MTFMIMVHCYNSKMHYYDSKVDSYYFVLLAGSLEMHLLCKRGS